MFNQRMQSIERLSEERLDRLTDLVFPAVVLNVLSEYDEETTGMDR